MRPRYRRRHLLAAVGAAVAGTGCLDGPSGRTGDPDVGCEDRDRWDLSFGDDLRYGENSGFALAVSPRTVAFGESVSFELRNESDARRHTGVDELHAFQVRGDGDWENVLARPAGFDGAAHGHDPGEGFEWSVEITRTGIAGSYHEICEPLTAGTYRFVYFGLPDRGTATSSDGGDAADAAVAVRFDVEES